MAIWAQRSDELHKAMFDGLRNILDATQLRRKEEERLAPVLNSLIHIGFDRVRVFRWDSAREVFVGWLSAGMNNPDLFVGFEIDPRRNSCAAETVAGAQAGTRARTSARPYRSRC